MGQNEPPADEVKLLPEYRFNLGYAQDIPGNTRQLEVGLYRDLLNIKQNKYHLGMGIRMGVQQNNELAFTTAHPDLKSTDNKVDTLYIDQAISVGFNFFVNAEYQWTKSIAFGANLDILGWSVGTTEDRTYSPGTTSIQEGHSKDETASAYPTQANAFSFGNSKGCLNSQLYVKFNVSRKVGIRLGMAYLFQEYSTERTWGEFNAYRFEHNGPAFFAGLTFNRFDEK
jgi:hypothetical protein